MSCRPLRSATAMALLAMVSVTTTEHAQSDDAPIGTWPQRQLLQSPGGALAAKYDDPLASIHVADINGDGLPDILAHRPFGTSPGVSWHSQSVLAGTAFWDEDDVLIGSYNDVVLADLDGDGRTDLAAARIGAISWWRNEAEAGPVGPFVEESPISTLNGLKIRAADIDGDGDQDLVTQAGSLFTTSVYWHENRLDLGESWVTREIGGAGILQELAVEDINDDGAPDVAIFGIGLDGSSVLAWRRNAQPTTDRTWEISFISNDIADLSGLALGDVDGDGDSDIVVTRRLSDTVGWFENPEAPMQAPWPFNEIADDLDQPEGVLAGDTDGDGDIDLVARSGADQSVVHYENTGGWTPSRVYIERMDAFVLAPLDHDDDLDLVAGVRDDGGLVTWFENRVGSTCLAQVLRPPNPVGGEHFGSVLTSFGNTLIVGAEGRDGVVIYRYDGRRWNFEAELLDPDGTGNGFGRSVAITVFDNGLYWAFVSAPDGAMGKVHVYARNDTPSRVSWLYVQELTGGFSNQAFGASIDADGYRLIVGTPGEITGGAQLFEFSLEDLWAPVEAPSPCPPGSEFCPIGSYGTAVAIDGDVVAVTSQPWVFVHEFDGSSWDLGVAFGSTRECSNFGNDLSVSGERVAIGESGAGEDCSAPLDQYGRAHVLRPQTESDSEWGFDETISDSLAKGEDAYGSSVSIDEAWLASGSPNSSDPGAASFLVHDGRHWVESGRVNGPLVFNPVSGVEVLRFGAAVEISSGVALVGAPLQDILPLPGSPGTFIDSGAVYSIAVDGPDCNGNGTPDVCDPDGDGDGVIDACDLCVDTPDPFQQNLDCDDLGDACDPDVDLTDPDGDGLRGSCDNCPQDFNPDQLNQDYDSAGDVCDCAPLDRATFPDAPEQIDGRDNQCPGDLGYGIIDELPAELGFESGEALIWFEVPGAMGYEVVRATDPSFATCESFELDSPQYVDSQVPPSETVVFYLHRATSGSWGAGSDGLERQPGCSSE